MTNNKASKTEHTWMIPAGNIDTLKRSSASLARRAGKLGVVAPSFEVTGEHVEHEYFWIDNHGSSVQGWSEVKKPSTATIKYTGHCVLVKHVKLIGVDTIKLAGWTFVATLDMELGEDNVVIVPAPGEVVPPEFRSLGNVCQHCNGVRYRKSTYVVRHESGKYAQVGSTCIRDFLGVDVKAALGALTLGSAAFGALGAAEERELGQGQGASESGVVDLTEYLAWVAKSIREHGWVSRGTADDSFGRTATADAAFGMMKDKR